MSNAVDTLIRQYSKHLMDRPISDTMLFNVLREFGDKFHGLVSVAEEVEPTGDIKQEVRDFRFRELERRLRLLEQRRSIDEVEEEVERRLQIMDDNIASVRNAIPKAVAAPQTSSADLVSVHAEITRVREEFTALRRRMDILEHGDNRPYSYDPSKVDQLTQRDDTVRKLADKVEELEDLLNERLDHFVTRQSQAREVSHANRQMLQKLATAVRTDLAEMGDVMNDNFQSLSERLDRLDSISKIIDQLRTF